MPINLDSLGARSLVDALLNPGTSSQVSLVAYAAGAVVWSGKVARASRTGASLVVGVLAPTATAPFAIDGLAVEFAALSLRSGVSSADVAFTPAAPASGYWISFSFLLSSDYAASPPSSTARDAAAVARDYANEARESSVEAEASSVAAALAKSEAETKAGEVSGFRDVAEERKSAAEEAAAVALTLKTASQTDRDAIGTLKGDAQTDRAGIAEKLTAAGVDRAEIADLKTASQTDRTAIATLKGAAQTDRDAVASAKTEAESARDQAQLSAAAALQAAAYIAGRPGGVRYADGYHGGSTAAPYPIGAYDFEIHAWIKFSDRSALSGDSEYLCWQSGGFAIARAKADGKLRVYADGGASAIMTSSAAVAEGAWLFVVYSRSSGIGTLYVNGASVATAADATSYPGSGLQLGGQVNARRSTANLYDFCAYNKSLSGAERAACLMGETPAHLLATGCQIAFVAATGQVLGSGHAVSAETVSGFTLTSTATAGSSASVYSQIDTAYPPTPMSEGNGGLVAYRVRFTATRTGYTACSFRLYSFYAEPGSESYAIAAGTANYEQVIVCAANKSPTSPLWFATGDGSLVVSNRTVERLGMVAHYAPDGLSPSGRWKDRTANAYDLAPSWSEDALAFGRGVAPVSPRPQSRRIAVKAAGASISSGSVASVGALTGLKYADSRAIAAVRQWDHVCAAWRQSRPSNAGALIAAATSGGAILVECAAHTSTVVIAAGTAVSLVHDIP